MAVRQGLLTCERADEMLDDLFAHLLNDWIVFADVGGNNLVYQRRLEADDRLVIIDGLGARHPGLKLWLQNKIPFLARRKLRKQWLKLLANIWGKS